ncbi:MAG: hypothetical protein R3B47_17235 [Bacteroidia bacterium]
MSKTHLFFIAVFISLFFSVLAGCKEQPVEPEAPSLNFATQAEAFQASQNLSNYTANPYAQLTYAYVTSLQSIFVAYSSFLTVPPNATGIGNNTWTWGDGAGNTINYSWSSNGGNNCVQISLNGPSVTNGVYYEFCEKQDGSSGWMKIFDPEDNGKLIIEAIWTVTGQDAGTMEWNDYGSGEKQVITWKADGSGTLNIYENNVLTYESSWNADGTGSYKEYDAQGLLQDAGTWG